MTKKNDTTFFENKLLDFVTAKDPMLEMLQWVMDKFMEIEVAHKTSFLRLNEFIQLNKIFIILCISYGYIFKTVIMIKIKQLLESGGNRHLESGRINQF